MRAKAMIGGKLVESLREISGGGALGSQNDMRAAFGLGDAWNVESIRFEWPSGMKQELRNVAPRQFLTVIEPTNTILPRSQGVMPGSNMFFTVSGTAPAGFRTIWTRAGVTLPGQTNAQLSLTNVSNADAGAYSVLFTNYLTGETITLGAAQLVPAQPATILAQPQPQYIIAGSNALFSVTAGGYGTKTYQWLFEGVPIEGATNGTLALTNVQSLNEGNYSVVVSNVVSSTVSSNAYLMLVVKPVIQQAPLPQTVAQGGSVTLSVSASGYPALLTYRWFANGIGVANMTLNQSNCFFTITNLQPTTKTNIFYYRVTVTNVAGSISSPLVPVTILSDSDHDGIPDEWEISHNLDPANAGDALLDIDQDGLSNLQEYLAGTDPHASDSFLRIDTLLLDANGFPTLRFMAASNKTYSAQAKSAFSAGSWQTIRQLSASATNRLVELQDTSATNNFRIYRLVTPARNEF